MDEVRVGVIGAKGLPFDVLCDRLKSLPARIVGVCGEGADAFQAHYQCERRFEDYRELLEVARPDLAFIFDGGVSTHQATRDALRGGSYVLAERPVAASSAEADALIGLQNDTGCYAMARFNRRFAQAYCLARELLARGEFGRPNMFLAKFQAPPYASDRAFLWSHLSHIVDAAVMLLGDLSIHYAQKKTVGDGQYCYQIVFASGDGCMGMIQSGSTQCYEYPMERVEVAGDQCNLIIDNIRRIEYNRRAPDRKHGALHPLGEGDALVWNQNFGQMTSYGYYGLEGLVDEIVDAALNRREPSVHMAHAAQTIKLLEEIERKVVSL